MVPDICPWRKAQPQPAAFLLRLDPTRVSMAQNGRACFQGSGSSVPSNALPRRRQRGACRFNAKSADWRCTPHSQLCHLVTPRHVDAMTRHRMSDLWH